MGPSNQKFSAMLFALMLSQLNAARILGIFVGTFKSHFAFNDGIMRSLVAAGHEVTAIGPFPATERIANYTIINWESAEHVNVGDDILNQYGEAAFLDLVKKAMRMLEDLYTVVLKMDEIQNVLYSKEKKYDLLFVEIMPWYQCCVAIAEKLGIPVIGTTAIRYGVLADAAIGNPHNPAVVPAMDSYLANMVTFENRLHSIMHYIFWKFCDEVLFQAPLNNIYSEYFVNFGLKYDKKPDLIFYNNHVGILPRPLSANAIEISGIHLKPVKPLPEDIEKFISEAEHGVIFISFGSIVKDVRLSPETIAMLVDIFEDLPQRVIWKHNEEIKRSKNVLVSKWWPQRDILAHQNVKAFITHCGISGLYEAIDAAIPLVMFPFFGDQLSNAAILEEKGVGVVLNWKTVTAQKLLASIESVVNDPKYKEKMIMLSEVFKDRPMSPQQMVVYWTEYVLRHNGSSHLQSVANNMPLYQYLLLDVLLLITVIASVTGYFTYFIFKQLFGRFWKPVKQGVINKKEE